MSVYYTWDDNLQKICDVAVDLKRKGKFNEANHIYRKLDINYPNNPAIYKAWAKTLAVSGNYDKGLEYFVKAKKLYEFFDNPVGKMSIEDCDHFIETLLTEPRDSLAFLNFLKSIAGNLNYAIDYNTIIDNIEIKNI